MQQVMTPEMAQLRVHRKLKGLNTTLPPYLYRVYALDSNGENSTESFASAAARNSQGRQNLSAIPYKEAKTMLTRHFLWTYFPGNEFTSWSSSLLYALQFAMRKTRNKVKTGKVSSECDIKVCVLDTSSLSTSSFFAAPELIRLYGISSSNEMRHEYHDNEYLFHGKLNVKRISSTITLARLREEGLFNLIPELDEEAHKTHLFLRVRDLRRSLFNIPRPISAVDGGLALWIASLFSQTFTMPMFVALLSLCRRDPGDKGFLRILRHYAEPSRDFRITYQTQEGREFPELTNFFAMMNVGAVKVGKIKAQRSNGVTGLEDLLGNLGLEPELDKV